MADRGIGRWMIAIAASGAAAGVAAALSLRRAVLAGMPPDQPLSYATAQGVNASGSFRLVFAAILLPLAGAFVYRFACRYLLAPEAAGWARWTAPAGAIAALFIALGDPPRLTITLAAALVPLATGALLSRHDPGFTRRDVVLIPSALMLFLASLDLASALGLPLDLTVAFSLALAGIALILAIRLLLSRIGRRESIPAGWSFFLSPLGAVAMVEPSPFERPVGAAIAAFVILASPFLVRLFILATPRAMRNARIILTFVVYPIFALVYPWTSGYYSLEPMPRIHMFEDGHNLMPASEMLRGELPYRDIIPAHGILSDGFIDYLALRFLGDTAGHALWVRSVLASLTSVAIYAVGYAATGSAEAGILAFLLATGTMIGGTRGLRFWPSMLALATGIAAVRRRSRKLLLVAGILLSLAYLMSLEFGVYASVAIGLAVVRWGSSLRERLRALGAVSAGVAAGLFPAAVAFTALGILDNFWKVTIREVLVLGPYYNVGLGTLPAEVRAHRLFPDLLAMMTEIRGWHALGWFAAVITFATILAMTPSRLRRTSEPLLMIGAWISIAALSWAERHHPYYEYLVPAFAITAVWALRRRRRPARLAAAGIAAVYLIVVAHPATHLMIMTIMRVSKPPYDASWQPWNGTPRAAGVLYSTEDITRLESVREFESRLPAGETWLDFANRPALYYLFDRPAPIRQYEVPFFQPEKRQRQVARTLETDRSITAVLVSYGPAGPPSHSDIDGVPNRDRAPLVWEVIQREFEPAWDRDGVVFWTRKGAGPR